MVSTSCGDKGEAQSLPEFQTVRCLLLFVLFIVVLLFLFCFFLVCFFLVCFFGLFFLKLFAGFQ